MLSWISKIFASQNERVIRRIMRTVEKINAFESSISALSDDDLKKKADEFRAHVAAKQKEVKPVLDELREKMSQMTSAEEKDKMRSRIRDTKNRIFQDILPEAFAVVREAAKRTVGMRHFDVQLIGGIVLHEGKISEMATGEGKTLVATLPAYLNALSGEGVHVVTVNDYLAKRDRDWMGPIYEFLGLSVGVIVHDMDNDSKKRQYACDITYGTNNEFGFDYLRDNLVISPEDIVQRKLSYAIVDEVDSILVDEARTPLIISGPVDSINTAFAENRQVVDHINRLQKVLIDDFIRELKKVLAEKNEDRAKDLMYIVHKGSPKEKEFLDIILKDPRVKAQFDKAMNYYDSKMMETERQELLENLYFVFEERSKEVSFTSKGEDVMKEKFQVEFIIEDLESKIAELSAVEMTDEEKITKEEELTREYISQQKKVDSIKQLLKAYVLFHKDVDYVINDNKILIVDEFTGRLMPGRRFSDGIHEAIEAKERVEVQQETQTHATVTLQNYFKMYEKLSGMTGTAATEAAEFEKIYALEVVVIPTNKPLKRENIADVIYKTENEKFKAIGEEVEKLHKLGRPVLVGTISIEKSEALSRVLRQRGVPHNVLNAKYHEMEAHIVAQAGAYGAVTIATNMAGRGTDILLGGNPENLAMDAVTRLNIENREEREEVFKRYLEEYKQKTKEAHAKVVEQGGLFVMGTERHESRRIDNQLRGRSGRQGDPGASRFYLSLEDDLMRIFGSDRIKMVMERLGMEEGQDIQHPLITRAIATAQRRVEMQNFEIRQHLLKYDNVMNQQRELIYERRRSVIKAESAKEELFSVVDTVIDGFLADMDKEDFIPELRKKLFLKLLLMFREEDLSGLGREELFEKISQAARVFYERKESMVSPERMRYVEKMIMLSVIDSNWKDYLYNMDQLREGINWRAYGQRDPLVEYQYEAFGMFKTLMETIDMEIVERIFRGYTGGDEKALKQVFKVEKEKFIHEEYTSLGAGVQPVDGDGHQPRMPAATSHSETDDTYKRNLPKVGRNDMCPCGSGKKYKKCCGAA